ncbi:indolepyruvate ferredoxin oxidoreductase [Thermocatellispora tengchongensis]|uniref:Indolepyruvate ferredoxin oxidoreductase n=1 Tax=Thermocatellispora tengchongensis TaxID=1073253 RepID=A0A840PLN2_9ACTN|nr:indolepyruvate ferredoxin oxidoreductase family protein [Thermocatellispora tengchongensis]MBB5139826.1 indolepyruvate ferredoxin oxidoreductase [Thermocatellispora tengchongensis]
MRLTDRLTADTGTHYLPGIQALVRFPLEQSRRDRADGLRIATLISGYPGSPLSGYDLALSRIPDLLDEHDVTLLPAGNEESAATAHMGTQMLDDHPHSRWDGVTSIWYGKGPGVDRSGDALKHGNFAGTSEHGAVVILSGDDHEAKSSTMPYQQDYAFTSAGIPILYPSSVAEFRTFGLHAIRLSRYSGCWVAMKLVSALCDGGESVTFEPGGVDVVLPHLEIGGKPFRKRTDFSFFPGKNIEMERHLYQEKHLAVREYARANGLDRIVQRSGRDTVGIVTAGKSFADVRQALEDLGVDPAAAGIRLLQIGLVYPLDEERIRSFAEGLRRIVVVEEKRGFLEQQVKAAVQSLGRPIEVIGKTDAAGRPVFPVEGGMDADLIAIRLTNLLREEFERAGVLANAQARAAEVESVKARVYTVAASRTPNFCSGCPHSASTVLAPGQVAWGSPGCNCFNSVIEQPERHIDVMTQYGGEGLPWIGLSRYTDRAHMVQHIGDGSIYHSSYLNIRWAVAAGVNITFKLLYNGVVANTGAQHPVGEHGLADLTRGLESEGVAKIVIVTKEPRRYRRQPLAPGVEVRHADRLVATAEELSRVPGTTVLIYDESCANERRRLQRRGKLAIPDKHVYINTDVCENCGDCGRASNCMSLQKTPTEFGPKTRVHASSCNQDYSCMKGDCPAFVTVQTAPATGYRKPATPALADSDLPEPERPRIDEPFHIHMPGVGGTGVLTLNGILSVAATLDGHQVLSYDQTGAAQKWGPVISSLVLAPPKAPVHANKVGAGRADLYLALDLVGAATPVNLDRCSPDRTATVLNIDLFPTGEQIRDVHAQVDETGLTTSIAERCARLTGVPARTIAEELFGDYMLTNIVALGAAYQAGLLPISGAAIEEAIGLNGVAVEVNRQAFRYGRLWAHDRTRIEERLRPPAADATAEHARRRAGLGARRRAAYDRLWGETERFDAETRRLLAVRLAELVDYQDERYARDYLDAVASVDRCERKAVPGRHDLTQAVARNLYKLMAYKDEYEVARLFLKPGFAAEIAAAFDKPVRITHHLQPPLARRLGRTRKLAVGPWFRPAFRLLRLARGLRGTALDPFKRQASRVEERELISWYRRILDEIQAELWEANHPVAVALAELPDLIRGFEEVKHRNAEAAKAQAAELRERLRRPMLPLTIA